MALIDSKCSGHFATTPSHRQNVPQKQFVSIGSDFVGSDEQKNVYTIVYECPEQLESISAVLTIQMYLFISVYKYC